MERVAETGAGGNSDEIPLCKTNHNFYKNSFFPSTTIEWNNLDHDLRDTESYTLFRSSILKFIRPSPNSFYNFQNIMGVNLVTRLRIGLSHLREYKFKHSFQDTLNPPTSNPPPIFYFNVPLILTKDAPLWATWTQLTHKYLKLLCNFWQAHSFLGIHLIATKRIHIFLTLLLTTTN